MGLVLTLINSTCLLIDKRKPDEAGLFDGNLNYPINYFLFKPFGVYGCCRDHSGGG